MKAGPHGVSRKTLKTRDVNRQSQNGRRAWASGIAVGGIGRRTSPALIAVNF
jgi:hypothetical protein